VTQFGRLFQVVAAFRIFQLMPGQFQSFTLSTQIGNRLFLVFPFCVQFTGTFFEFSKFFFQIFATFDGSGIFFLLQTGDFDFQTH